MWGLLLSPRAKMADLEVNFRGGMGAIALPPDIEITVLEISE